ncbi:MAG: hypothetical protein GXC78_18200 [Chitinophagaceae bacterium]|jgi:hypothetical protein|nr:hypothetical protein [Chitinophagaceae bacterium]
MTKSIIERVQEQLGYPPLHKVDPNTQELPATETSDENARFAQAAIPSVLAGIFQQSRTEAGAVALLQQPATASWTNLLFGTQRRRVMDAITQYAGRPAAGIENELDIIAQAAMSVLRPGADMDHPGLVLRETLNAQRHTILVYLPAALHMGEMLRDESLDDRTNKMEGPVSNLMHSIENKLSGGGS